MHEKEELELNSEALFFEAIRNANIPDILKFFRDEKIKPWEFLYEDEFSGNLIKEIKNTFHEILKIIYLNTSN
jgi:hypothetical protein